MEKIKVLHITETFAAGVYTYIKDICSFFDKEPRFETYVIFSGKREDTDRKKFHIDFSSKINLIEVSMEREISPFKDFKSYNLISKKIKEIKPDIIHLHSSKAGVIGRIASKSHKAAKVYYTPNGYSFVRLDVSSFKRKAYTFIELLINKIYGGVTIACGDTEYEHAKKLGKALLVRNGIDIKNLKVNTKQANNEFFTIGTVGRMSPQKNPKLFNDIANQLPNVKFVWIGDGELKSELTADNIVTTGWLKREDALEKVSSFDIYIQTSSWEGLPFTIIEAMALGKPIIATNVIGNKDAVKHGYNGFLCDNVNDFVIYINSFLLREKSIMEFGLASVKRSNKIFDRDKNFKKLAEIYLTHL